MREKGTILFALLIIAIMIPYLGTVVMTGTIGTELTTVETLDTGRSIALEKDGQYLVMDVEEYLKGTLPTVIEGTENEEMWKTVAVVERTNLYKKMSDLTQLEAADLELEYLSEEEVRELWGERNYKKYQKALEKAIIETAGITLQYDGSCIDALYHKVSVGMTASAEELYGEAVPYLVSVASSQDVESKDYMNIVEIPKGEPEVLEVTESTEHGYVKSVLCDGETLSGEEARERFGLSSLNFYIEDMGDRFRIVCLGKGHGMGLSLYGANKLAEEGRNYEEILLYYYPGCQLD